MNLGLPDDFIFHYVGEVGDMRRFRISYQQEEAAEWEHIDFFDDKATKLPKLLLLNKVYLEMHNVKEGSAMDTFESLGYTSASVDSTAWSTCEDATNAVRENRAVNYLRAFNLTMEEEGASIADSVLAEYEFSNATAVLGVPRDAHAGRDLDAEAAAWDWRTPYPPRIQGPNSYDTGAVNWYANAAGESALMHDDTYMAWFDENQAAGKDYFDMMVNGTIPAGSRRTMGGNPVARRRRTRVQLDIGILSLDLDDSVPSLTISSEIRGVTFELDVTAAGGSIAIKFEAEGCMYEVLCLTGTGSTSANNPGRHVRLEVVVSLSVSGVVDELLDPIPGFIRNKIVSLVAYMFDKEYGRIQYDYYKSARIHEKWERVNVCAPCHILQARLNVFSGHYLIDPHLRGFIGVAAVYAPKFHAYGVWKRYKKDSLWGVTDNKNHLMMQGNVGFEYKIPGIGFFTGWQTGWSQPLFTVDKWAKQATWWTSSQRNSRISNKLQKAWDYKYGWGNNDKVDQFYY